MLAGDYTKGLAASCRGGLQVRVAMMLMRTILDALRVNVVIGCK
jgi:hypothetical protein